MRKGFVRRELLIFTVFLISLTCLSSAFYAKPAPTISLGIYEVEVDSTVSVPVTITDASPIAGGAVKIMFDRSVVEVQEVLEGDFEDPVANIQNDDGFIFVACALPSSIGKDEAILARVEFVGASEGETGLKIASGELNDEEGNLLTPTTVDGRLVVRTGRSLTLYLVIGGVVVIGVFLAGLFYMISTHSKKPPPTAAELQYGSLYCRQGPEQGRNYPLLGRTMMIGRARDNDVVLSDSSMSRRHARMSFDGVNICIEDLNSRNGTRVNGQAISPGDRRRLENGDEIEVGVNTCLVLRK